ncbi:MAG: glycosyltransferase family A protein [Cyanobacteria bacterium J06649_4]
MTLTTAVGIVVVGRNEGDYLHGSLTSALANKTKVVYVDSGSTDDSLEIAAALNVDIVQLDPSTPFTAPRAYNAGVSHLLTTDPNLEFVQFLDGDAELNPSWMTAAYRTITSHPNVAVVCGRRRERFPQKSPYNLVADIEWDTDLGIVSTCGPEAMMRLSLFQQVGGFNGTLIAGDEPELCFRLRQAGGQILRIDADSSHHDMDMMKFQTWWQRSRRGGYAFAEEAWIHRTNPAGYRLRECSRIWFWAFFFPLTAIALAWPTQGISLLALPVGYAAHIAKNYLWAINKRGYPTQKALIYSLFCLLMKFAKGHGQVEFLWCKLQRRRRGLIEYRPKQVQS